MFSIEEFITNEIDKISHASGIKTISFFDGRIIRFYKKGDNFLTSIGYLEVFIKTDHFFLVMKTSYNPRKKVRISFDNINLQLLRKTIHDLLTEKESTCKMKEGK